jgi:hypothetical protein
MHTSWTTLKSYKAVSPSWSHADSCNNACAQGIETKLHDNTVVMEDFSSKLKNDFRIRIWIELIIPNHTQLKTVANDQTHAEVFVDGTHVIHGILRRQCY